MKLDLWVSSKNNKNYFPTLKSCVKKVIFLRVLLSLKGQGFNNTRYQNKVTVKVTYDDNEMSIETLAF